MFPGTRLWTVGNSNTTKQGAKAPCKYLDVRRLKFLENLLDLFNACDIIKKKTLGGFNMNYTIYEVLGTATITASQREAVEYYRQGFEIAVLSSKDGILWEQVALWYH